MLATRAGRRQKISSTEPLRRAPRGWPYLLATALLLQTYDKVSDAEAKARADFDIQWKSPPSATTGGGVGD